MNYFRITGYNQKGNYCFIMDCNGMFEQLWQFSKYLIDSDMDVIELSKNENFIDGNIPRVEEDKAHIIARKARKHYTRNKWNQIQSNKSS